MSEDDYPFITRTDLIERHDKKRLVVPETIVKEDGHVVFKFPWKMFRNPKYTIPKTSEQLFKGFINGGSRSYSSDGKIPAIRATIEAQKIINEVRMISRDKTHEFNGKARKAIMIGPAEREDFSVVRGTIGLMLGKWMAPDWQKKRYTDDIDFYWEEIDSDLWNHVMKKLGWTTEDKTPGNWSIYTKHVPEVPEVPLECCNDTSLGKDFGGAEAAVEGPGLKGIIKKKFLRCHDVDINDILNVAIRGYLNIDEDEENHPWRAVMETLWRGGEEDVSHVISVCQYAFSIAQHYRNVGHALEKHVKDFLVRKQVSDEEIRKIYNTHTPVLVKSSSYYWEPFGKGDATSIKEMRHELYNFFLKQAEDRVHYGSRLNTFAHALNWALNKRFRRQKIKFFIAKKRDAL
ncbi:MAG: hypothetical protein ACTSUE_14520 [Promethearchaeota archaeon]